MRQPLKTRTARRRLLAALAGLLLLGPRGGASRAQEPGAPVLDKADWRAIKRVITEQLAALREGAAERAFAHAAEGIQQQFGDPATFLDMVRSGYAPLLDARYTEFLEGAVIEGAVIQPLRLVAPDNTVRVALYTMQKDGSRWRIAGCVIAPSTVKAA